MTKSVQCRLRVIPLLLSLSCVTQENHEKNCCMKYGCDIMVTKQKLGTVITYSNHAFLVLLSGIPSSFGLAMGILAPLPYAKIQSMA